MAKATKKDGGHKAELYKLDKNKQIFYDAMLANLGVVSNAAIACGLSRAQHYNWMKDDKLYKERIEDIAEQLVDMSENVVLTSIKAGNLKAATFYLQKKGGSRGYGNKVEISGGITVEGVQVVKPKIVDGE